MAPLAAPHRLCFLSLAILEQPEARPAPAGEGLLRRRPLASIGFICASLSLLGIPPMNSNDANAAPIASLFSSRGHAPFTADHRNLDNGLLYKVNPPKGPGAAQSAAMDFTHADRADSATLNSILWENRMGDKPMPVPRGQKR